MYSTCAESAYYPFSYNFKCDKGCEGGCGVSISTNGNEFCLNTVDGKGVLG